MECAILPLLNANVIGIEPEWFIYISLHVYITCFGYMHARHLIGMHDRHLAFMQAWHLVIMR